MASRRQLFFSLVLTLFFSSLASCQSWIQLSPSGTPPPDTINSAIGTTPSDRVIFWGGCCSHPQATWVLTNADGIGVPQWVQLSTPGTLPPGRHAQKMVYDATNNRMMIFGGCLGGCLPTTNDTWVLSNADGSGGATSTWTQIAATGPSGRINPAMAYDPNSNRIMLYGGQNGGGTVVGSTFFDYWILTNANGLGGTPQWLSTSVSGTSPQYNPVVGYDPASNRMIAAGGVSTSTGASLNSVWLLMNANGTAGTPTWINLIPDGAAGAPPAATFQTATGSYDQANNRLIVVGLSTVWVLSNANGLGGTPVWTQLSTGTGPTAANGDGYNGTSNRLTTVEYTVPNARKTWVLTQANGLAAPTTTTVTSATSTIDSDDSATFTATVTSSNGTPTGSVQFFVDGVAASSAITLVGGQATFTTRLSTAGSHSIQAQYTPDNSLFASSNGSFFENVVSLGSLPVLNGNNTFTGNQTINGSVSATSFFGDGSGLNNVTAVALNCAGCVGNPQLGVNYALGDAKGGSALNALALDGFTSAAFAPASGSPNYVAKTGDTMTGSLALPANGLTAGGNQFVLSGGNVGIHTPTPSVALDVENGSAIINNGGAIGATPSATMAVRTLTLGLRPDGYDSVLTFQPSAGENGSIEYGTSAHGQAGFFFFANQTTPAMTIAPSGNVGIAGNINSGGSVSAASFSGDGSGLTNITAVNANHALNADFATNAGHASSADNATFLLGNIQDNQVLNLNVDLANATNSAVSTSEAYANGNFLRLTGGVLTGFTSLSAGGNAVVTNDGAVAFDAGSMSTTPESGGVGIVGHAADNFGVGVYGYSPVAGPDGQGVGVEGDTQGDFGAGVIGFALSKNPNSAGIGVQGISRSDGGVGVWGLANDSSTGPTAGGIGVFGVAKNENGYGVAGRSNHPTGNTVGISGRIVSPNGTAGRFVNDAGGDLIRGYTGANPDGTPANLVFRVGGDSSVHASSFFGDGSNLTNVSASFAANAQHANAADFAQNSQHSQVSDSATNAGHANVADNATFAGSAGQAGQANFANSAGDSLMLGGIVAANYARLDVAQTFTADEAFPNISVAGNLLGNNGQFSTQVSAPIATFEGPSGGVLGHDTGGDNGGGVVGVGDDQDGFGVAGIVNTIGGAPTGVIGRVRAAGGVGVKGFIQRNPADLTMSSDGAIAVLGLARPDTGFNIGVQGETFSSFGVAGSFINHGSGNLLVASAGVEPLFTVTGQGNVVAKGFFGDGSGLTNLNVGTVANATHANTADFATNAGHATSADSATTAATATNANHATSADSATSAATATNASHATTADSATTAGTATNATNALALGGVTAANYARLDIANNFTGNQSVSGNVSTTGSVTIASGTPITGHISMLVNPAFPVLNVGQCLVASFPLAGASDGDTIALGVPNSRMNIGGNIIYTGWVSAADTVTVQACNVHPTNAQKIAGTGAIRIDLWKH